MTKPPANVQPPTSDVFSEAARSGLTALNATAVVAGTTVSAALSLYADIAGPAAPAITGHIALAGWLASIGLALYLAGRGSGRAGSATVLGALGQGLQLARARPGFAAIVLLLSLGATLTVWSRARADHGGLLASIGLDAKRAASAAESASATAGAIKDDTSAIRAAVVRTETPVELLARKGFGQAPQDLCRVISEGNLEAASLFKQAGVPAAKTSVALGGGQFAFCPEPAFLGEGKGRPIAETLKILPLDPDDLRRLYIVQAFGSSNPGKLEPLALLPKVGIAKPGQARMVSVRATPLMLAVWADDLALIDALLAQGADPNEGGRYDFAGGTLMTVSASPLAEALRLGNAQAAERLKAAGTRSAVARLPFAT